MSEPTGKSGLLPCPICGKPGKLNPYKNARCSDEDCLEWQHLDLWQSLPRQSDELRDVVREMRGSHPSGAGPFTVIEWADRLSRIADKGERGCDNEGLRSIACDQAKQISDAHEALDGSGIVHSIHLNSRIVELRDRCYSRPAPPAEVWVGVHAEHAYDDRPLTGFVDEQDAAQWKEQSPHRIIERMTVHGATPADEDCDSCDKAEQWETLHGTVGRLERKVDSLYIDLETVVNERNEARAEVESWKAEESVTAGLLGEAEADNRRLREGIAAVLADFELGRPHFKVMGPGGRLRALLDDKGDGAECAGCGAGRPGIHGCICDVKPSPEPSALERARDVTAAYFDAVSECYYASKRAMDIASSSCGTDAILDHLEKETK